MITRIRNRLACIAHGHAWGPWTAWEHGGARRWWRERHCTRCPATRTHIDAY